MVRVAVVGAGISGLSTATRIQDHIPGSEVTIVADRFTPNTTSDCAAGLCSPYLVADTPEHKVREWSKATMDHMRDMYNSPEAAELGVSMVTGFFLYGTKQTDLMYKDLYVSYTKLDDITRNSLYPGYEDCYKLTTFMTESILYLPQLMKRFEKNGGRLYQCKVHHLSELYDKYDVIVNTTGLGATSVVNDRQITPIRGQAFRVSAPWVKHFVVDVDNVSYVLPGVASVVVGGTHQAGNWNLNVCDRDGDEILRKAYQLIPGLKKAPIVREVVGLRPSRSAVRVEREIVKHGNKNIPIIHNYGHGGSGITLFWGCSGEAVELLQKSLHEVGISANNSKL